MAGRSTCGWATFGRATFAWALGLAAATLLLLAGVEATRAQTSPAATQQVALIRALRYTAFGQVANGGYGGIGATADVVLAVSAAGRDAASFGLLAQPSALPTLLSQTQALTRSLSGGELGKLALSAVAADTDPRNFAGYNLPLSLTAVLSPSGAYDPTIFNHTLAMLGVAATGETVPLSATAFLRRAQGPTGGWDDGFGSGENVDTTALAMQALVAAGVPLSDTALLSATAFLDTRQNADAGWGFSRELSPTNSNSTAFALQALQAIGEDYTALTGTWAVANTTPLSTLLALQAPSGGFGYQAGDAADAFSTRQAIPGLAGQPFPVIGRREAARRATAWLQSRQNSDGSFEEFGGPFAGNKASGTARAIRAGITDTATISALQAYTPAYLTSGRGGRVGNIMRGVAAASPAITVTSVGGLNLVVSMTSFLSPDGRLDSTVFGHLPAMLGLQEAGFFSGTLAMSSTFWLTSTAIVTGSADLAGQALQALHGAGLPAIDPQAARAIAFLLATQGSDGGWGFGPQSNANSTSEAARGLLAYGIDVRLLQRANQGRLASPLSFLTDAQRRDGAYDGFAGPDEYATTDALFGLRATYPSREFPLLLNEALLPVVTK